MASTPSTDAQCDICYATGNLWAERMLNTPGLTHGDIVWLNAEAEDAFKRTDTATNLRADSSAWPLHQRSFVSGAVDFYEAAYQTASIGFPIQPAPITLDLAEIDKVIADADEKTVAQSATPVEPPPYELSEYDDD